MKKQVYDEMSRMEAKNQNDTDDAGEHETFVANFQFEDAHKPQEFDEGCKICNEQVEFSISKFCIKLHCLEMKFEDYDFVCLPTWVDERESKIVTNSLTLYSK